jgi:hypothetical protein
MNIAETQCQALQVVTGVDRDGRATQSVICVDLATGPNDSGYWASPEVFRVAVPSVPVLEVPFGAWVRFRNLSISEWSSAKGTHGVRRAAESAEVVRQDPAAVGAKTRTSSES